MTKQPKPSKEFRKAYRQALFMAHTSRWKQSARTWARLVLKALRVSRRQPGFCYFKPGENRCKNCGADIWWFTNDEGEEIPVVLSDKRHILDHSGDPIRRCVAGRRRDG